MRITNLLLGFILFVSAFTPAQNKSLQDIFNQIKIIYGDPAPYVGLESLLMNSLISAKSIDAEIQRYIMKYEDLKQRIEDYNTENKRGLETDNDFLINLERNFSVKERNIANALGCRFGTSIPKEFIDLAITNTNANCVFEYNKIKSFNRNGFYVNKYPCGREYFFTLFLIERKEYNYKDGEWFNSKVLQSFPDTPFKFPPEQ